MTDWDARVRAVLADAGPVSVDEATDLVVASLTTAERDELVNLGALAALREAVGE